MSYNSSLSQRVYGCSEVQYLRMFRDKRANGIGSRKKSAAKSKVFFFAALAVPIFLSSQISTQGLSALLQLYLSERRVILANIFTSAFASLLKWKAPSSIRIASGWLSLSVISGRLRVVILTRSEKARDKSALNTGDASRKAFDDTRSFFSSLSDSYITTRMASPFGSSSLMLSGVSSLGVMHFLPWRGELAGCSGIKQRIKTSMLRFDSGMMRGQLVAWTSCDEIG